MLGSWFLCYVSSLRRIPGFIFAYSSRYTTFLEGGRFNHTHQQAGEAAIVFFELFDDLVHRLDVRILQATANRVGEQLFGEAFIELAAMVIGQDAL